MKRFLYRIYQLFVALPILLLATALTAIVTTIGCTFGKARFWSHYPAMVWSRLMCWCLFLPVKVYGMENLNSRDSYVFVANHQGSFDIFLIYGYIGRNFKWMMKKSLRSIPLVGKACESAGHIFVDKRGPGAIRHTYEQASGVLRHGVSLMVFPEGSRTDTGKMGHFQRGAYLLADELQLPIVPVTIEGSFEALPRSRGFYFVERHTLSLRIHKPILPQGKGLDNVQRLMELSRVEIQKSLPEKYRDE